MSDRVREYTWLWGNGERPDKKENIWDFGCDLELWVTGEAMGGTQSHQNCCITVEYNENVSEDKALASNHRVSRHT